LPFFHHFLELEGDELFVLAKDGLQALLVLANYSHGLQK
jgi:hypothetical protein